jgi:Uma2 family endonuclease
MIEWMNARAKIHPPFTSAEFYRMAEGGAFRGMRVELRRGMILKMSPQHYPHARMKADLQQALIRAIAEAGLGWEVLTEATVSFADGFEPMPDIVVIDAGMTPNVYRTIPASAVRLIVEVGDSTLADDLGDKRLEYAQAGLAEYWVADVQGRAVIRHAQPGADGYLNEAAPIPISQPIPMLTQPAVSARV